MKKIILFLITLITLTNISFASFPVTKDLNNTTAKTELIEKSRYDDSIQWLFIALVCSLLGFLLLWDANQGSGGEFGQVLISLVLFIIALIFFFIWTFKKK